MRRVIAACFLAMFSFGLIAGCTPPPGEKPVAPATTTAAKPKAKPAEPKKTDKEKKDKKADAAKK